MEKSNVKLEKLSATELKMAKQCEKKLFFKRTRPKPEKISHYLLIGIVFHEVVEKYLSHFQATGQRSHLSEFEAEFVKLWTREKFKGDFSKLDEDACRRTCWQYLQNYYQKRLGLLFPAKEGGIEHWFTFTAKEGTPDPSKNALGAEEDIQKLKIVGKIDLVTLDGSVVDHKTASSPWKQEEAENDPQAHIYPFGLQANGIKAERFFFNVVTKKDVQVLEVKPDKNKFNFWMAYSFELQRNFPDNLLVTNSPRICGMCEWKEICPDFKAGKNG